MRLLIGLGNPGKKFFLNRHNVGQRFVDYVNEKIKSIKSIKSIKTDCFMNESGKFVKKISRTYNLEPSDLFIVHDDLDLKLGQWKIQLGVGPKVHYGINSIEETLGTKNFWRIRIGVDNRDSGQARMTGEEYVLRDFTSEEFKILDKVFDEIIRSHPWRS